MVNEERVLTRRRVSTSSMPAEEASLVDVTSRRSPSGAEIARRVLVFLFAIVQVLLLSRLVLLLLDASRGNALVRFIYDMSGAFVAPFEGILRTNAVQSGGSVLDVAALVALVGWTLLEALFVAAIAIARREP